jgi:cobalt-precorrin-5B (C1)-methyltransferase
LLDLHSRKGSVDLGVLAELAEQAGGTPTLAERIRASNTAAEAFAHAEAEGVALGHEVARAGWQTAAAVVAGEPVEIEIAVFDRDGRLVGHAPFRAAHTAPPRKRRR